MAALMRSTAVMNRRLPRGARGAMAVLLIGGVVAAYVSCVAGTMAAKVRRELQTVLARPFEVAIDDWGGPSDGADALERISALIHTYAAPDFIAIGATGSIPNTVDGRGTGFPIETGNEDWYRLYAGWQFATPQGATVAFEPQRPSEAILLVRDRTAASLAAARVGPLLRRSRLRLAAIGIDTVEHVLGTAGEASLLLNTTDFRRANAAPPAHRLKVAFSATMSRTEARRTLDAALGSISRHAGRRDRPLRVREPADGARWVEELMANARRAVTGVMLASGIYCALTLAAALLVDADSRRFEVGLKRSLGASRRAIVVERLTESVLYTASFGALGLAIGSAAGLLTAQLVTGSFVLPVGSLLSIFALQVATGLVAGAAPAIAAAWIDPISALRAES